MWWSVTHVMIIRRWLGLTITHVTIPRRWAGLTACVPSRAPVSMLASMNVGVASLELERMKRESLITSACGEGNESTVLPDVCRAGNRLAPANIEAT